MLGRGTNDPIFTACQLQEKYLAKEKNHYFAFVNLEKAFHRVPRKVFWCSKGVVAVPEWIIEMLVITVILFLIPSILSLLLSKSSVQMCENRGLHGHGDPQNLVDGKSCEKKLIVVMTVKNDQKGTEKLYATVSRVRDETSNEFARLYNPFMITLSKSPVLVNYPYFYTGFSVNNQPYEEIKMMKGNWWAADSSKQCYDQWQSEEQEELKPTCGYQYSTTNTLQPDGSYKEVKNRIWDSQGFCCHCSEDEKNANTFEEAKNYKRSGLNCKFFTKSSQASGHCMKMDKLWYTVHSFTESYRDFTIHIRAFDEIEKVVNDKTVIDYVNGGEIVLSPSQKSGVGKYQRIIAHYVGDFAPVKSYPVLTERYLLIPKVDKNIDAERHPQIKDGASKYLILPMSFVDLRGGACNKIGVSYSSFKNQASSGGGFGCQQQKGYCLMNQPFNFFKEDEDRVNKGETPLWFPARYGKLVGIKKQTAREAADSFILSYESEEDHVSLVSLQISADDVILIVNRASGEIVRAAIKDFESLSLNGKLHVEVRNTGYVTADFYVSIPVCSAGIHQIQEKGASIDPQMTKSFTFSLKTHEREGLLYTCIVQLFDSKRALLAQRNISFSTTTPCVCEEMACRCECAEDGGVKCIKMAGKAVTAEGVFEVTKKSSGFFDSIANIFGGIDNMFSGLFGGFWPYIKGIVMCVVGLIAVTMFINCGGFKLVKSVFNISKFKSSKSMFSKMKSKFRKQEPKFKDGEMQGSSDGLDDQINSKSKIDSHVGIPVSKAKPTKNPVKSQRRIRSSNNLSMEKQSNALPPPRQNHISKSPSGNTPTDPSPVELFAPTSVSAGSFTPPSISAGSSSPNRKNVSPEQMGLLTANNSDSVPLPSKQKQASLPTRKSTSPHKKPSTSPTQVVRAPSPKNPIRPASSNKAGKAPRKVEYNDANLSNETSKQSASEVPLRPPPKRPLRPKKT